MANKKSLPSPITILMGVIILAALSTWLLPAGQYSKLAVENNLFNITTNAKTFTLPLTQKTLDSLQIKIPLINFTSGAISKPISIPGTYTKLARNGQGPIDVLQAPIKGIEDSIGIILFILIMGGFMYVFNETGAIVKGITYLSHSMRNRMPLLIVLLTCLFSFLAASYGMAEESLVFYPLLVPLFLAAGYDLLVPLAIIFGGTMLGGIAAFSNPFSVIIASNAAGINWLNGIYQRLLLFAISTAMLCWYILRYAKKVKTNPSLSLVLKYDGAVTPPYNIAINNARSEKLDAKTISLLLIYFATFLTMIGGVIFLKWWTTEMSTLFLGASILVAIICRINEKVFEREFIKGAESLLSVAFIVGIARGVTIILNNGQVSDSILYHAANLVQGMPPAIFILLLLVFFMIISLFISSSSGLAVLTMPIMGALAIMVNLPGAEIVNSYMYGMALMSFLSPTNMILPSLALVNISLKAWVKFIMPLLIALTILCAIFLIVGVYL